MSPLAAMKRAMITSTGPHLAGLLLLPLLLFTAPQALAKKDLFHADHVSSTAPHSQELIAPAADSSSSEIEEPALSATDAALRAQRHSDGKVMNVRQFQEENKTLYGVKVLQKNGRMKTINVDANSGSIVE